MSQLNVLGISGSLRKASLNKKVLGVALGIAESKGAAIGEADLAELDIPLFNQDIEDAGMPESVAKFRKLIEWADVLIISSPEYNHSISAALKNALDWGSRDRNAFKGKVAALTGASPGSFGTVRAQPEERHVLQTLGVYMLPMPEVMVSKAGEAFDETGKMIDERALEKLKTLVADTLEFAVKLKA